MLTDPEEIAIIASAEQSGVRNPQRSREPFFRIFNDFFSQTDFEGRDFLDLGPGQFDFGEMARARGGRVQAVDRDPAVLKLGKHKGFDVVTADLASLKADDLPQRYDGIFCKYSCNAFWYPQGGAELASHIEQLDRMLKPGGWAWIAPWNGVARGFPEARVPDLLQEQARLFEAHGFSGLELSKRLSIRYGVHGSTANSPLFTRNLPRPWRTLLCQRP